MIPFTTAIPARFPKDIVFFSRNNTLFVAALERSEQNSQSSDSLVIYDNSFKEVTRIKIANGVKLTTFQLQNVSLIAVAENDTARENFNEKSAIYEFNSTNLLKLQTLNMHYASDVAIWKIHHEVFMSSAHFMTNRSGNISYEVESPIYKWKGGHFDLVQTIPTKGAKKMVPFKVGSGHFLAIANSQDNQGNV